MSKPTMDLFYKCHKKYNINDFKMQIKNVEIIDLYMDDYENERKADKLKYFKEPKPTAYPINLNEGYDKHRFRKFDYFYGKTLDKVIKWDMKQPNLDNCQCNEMNTFNVYTHRQALINIMSHFNKIYSQFSEWNLYATKFGNNLYIYCENDAKKDDSAEDKIKRSHHYKLEQLLFSDSPNEEPKPQEPVDENIRLNGIYRCQLGKFNLIYSAEVQGIISDEEIKDLNKLDSLNKCSFVNTKVTYEKKYKYPLIEIQKYFQNRLANVDVTYFAFKDNEGYVHKPLKTCLTSDMCKGKSWNSKEYEQFVYDFLKLIVKKMSGVNCLETTYEFKYCSKNKAVYYKIHEGHTDKSFLPEDYIKFKKQTNN